MAVERSQLARLRADEQYTDRRLMNIQNFGAGWLRPPGVPKTLFQLREEQREAAEHAEAMRREQVQAELAEAEAGGGGEEPFDGESALDEMGDGARDLDEDIPDADASGMGMSGIAASEISSDPVSSDVDADEEDEAANDENDRSAEGRESELIQARMRMGNDSFRQALARGDADAGDLYGAEEELEAEDDGQLLLEEDSSAAAAAQYSAARNQLLDEDEGDMDMEADLDGSVPEASQMSGVYEHTDSEAELSSSLPSSSRSGSSDAGRDAEGGSSAWRQRMADADPTAGFLPRSSVGALGMPPSPTLRARGADKSGRGPRRGSMDLSSLLSGGESSVLDSSPQRR